MLAGASGPGWKRVVQEARAAGDAVDTEQGWDVPIGIVCMALGCLAVWGAWRLGVMAGDKVDLRRGLSDVPSMLRKGPNPQPVPIPTQRRPAVETPQR